MVTTTWLKKSSPLIRFIFLSFKNQKKTVLLSDWFVCFITVLSQQRLNLGLPKYGDMVKCPWSQVYDCLIKKINHSANHEAQHGPFEHINERISVAVLRHCSNALVIADENYKAKLCFVAIIFCT